MRTREFFVYETEICSANILRVAAGTNGLCGGDTGHGGHTVIELGDSGGTDLSVKLIPDGVRLELGGDCELLTVIEAFKYVASTLERQIKEYEALTPGADGTDNLSLTSSPRAPTQTADDIWAPMPPKSK